MSTYDGNLVSHFNFMLLLQYDMFEFVGGLILLDTAHIVFSSELSSHFNLYYCRNIFVNLKLKFDKKSPISEGSQTVDLKVQLTIAAFLKV